MATDIILACMRMRKLGQGQFATFCASLEIKWKILEAACKTKDATVEVIDVLIWAISQTFAQTRRTLPLWVVQGLRITRQEFIATNPSAQDINWLTKELPEKEAQALEDRYNFKQIDGAAHSLLQQELDEFKDARPRIDAIRAKCRDFGLAESSNDASLHEEQERELAPENEREQQVERPPPSAPCAHSVHKDVRLLVETDNFRRCLEAFQPAFKSLVRTTAAQYYESGAWAGNLYVSTDFACTIETRGSQLLDFFLRPVHWLLSFQHKGRTFLLVLSPFEVQELMPVMRAKKNVVLHVYSARLTNSSLPLDGLRFCAFPPLDDLWTSPCVRQLNLFAGQIYLPEYKKYVSLCEFLAICYKALDGSTEVSCDGFIIPSQRRSIGENDLSLFQESPVVFLKTLFDVRRKGVSYRTSHIGRILHGELLEEDQFQKSD
jgi:hypothetical protein